MYLSVDWAEIYDLETWGALGAHLEFRPHATGAPPIERNSSVKEDSVWERKTVAWQPG